MKNYITLQSLTFSFDTKSKLFFENVHFVIKNQGLIFLVGKNGAGKSTLFRLMQGLVGKNEHISGSLQLGDVLYDLENVQDRDRLKNKTMLLHQNFDQMLAPSFTGLQNLSFAQFGNYPGLSKVQAIEKISDLAVQFAIPLDKPVGLLSGGQRQMLALLMAVQKDIDLLLLDEPTSALDTKNSQYMMQGIEQLIVQRNLSVICISHDQDLIASYSKHILDVVINEQDKREVILTKSI